MSCSAEFKMTGIPLGLDGVDLSQLTELLDSNYLNEITDTCSYHTIGYDKTLENFPKSKNVQRTHKDLNRRPLSMKTFLNDRLVVRSADIRRKSLITNTDFLGINQQTISNLINPLKEKVSFEHKESSDPSHRVFANKSMRNIQTGLSAPPPPKLYRVSGDTHSPIKSNTLFQQYQVGRSPTANRAIHVVSGLGKGKKMPVPVANRTMANGDFGDDAAFFVETANNYVLGISDGAGGNRGYGFDPRMFARQLMRHCADYILAKNHKDKAEPAPSQTVFTALQMCQDRKIYGSGTICICSFNKNNGNLHTINIGDSGFLIIRHNAVYRVGKRNYRNDGSNAPLQLDVYPWSFRNRAQFMVETHEIGNINDMKDCVLMKPGDLLMMASDGVFDSIPQHVILQTITSSIHKIYPQNASLDSIKQRLIETADLVVGLASRDTTNAPDDVIVVLAMFM